MEHITLYRKYRPQKFADILGQDTPKQLISEQITDSKLSHAYLFTGPRGTGKTSMARLLAKGVNCLRWQDVKDVCDKCSSCNLINQGQSIDIIEIDAASNRGIDEIRKLREGVNFSPAGLTRKVYIIDEIHMLTKDAFNSLLKTIEEPPSHVIFVFATTEVHKVPMTILSRVQRFDFQLAGKGYIKQKLEMVAKEEGVDLSTEVVDLIFDISRGSFRDAESLLGKIFTQLDKSLTSETDVAKVLGIVDNTSMESLLDAYHATDHTKIISILDRLEKQGINALTFLNQFIQFLGQNHIVSEQKELNALNIVLLESISTKVIDVRASINPYLVIKAAILSAGGNIRAYLAETREAAELYSKGPVEEVFEDKLIGSGVDESSKLPVKGSFSEVSIEALAKQVMEKNMRLGIMLSSCNIVHISDTRLNIVSSFQFDIEIINKENSKQLIIDIAKKHFAMRNLRTVVCEFVEQVEKVADSEQDTSIDENIPAVSAEVAGNDDKMDGDPNERENSNEQLVEGIF